MATIQVQEIPEDLYEVLRRRARPAGQSMQAYMRDQLVALARRPTKEEAIEAVLSRVSGEDPAAASIAADLAAERRRPMALVIDASAMLSALLGRSGEAAALRGRLRAEMCHAPHLIDAEVRNVLRRHVLRGDLAAGDAGRGGAVAARSWRLCAAAGRAAWRLAVTGGTRAAVKPAGSRTTPRSGESAGHRQEADRDGTSNWPRFSSAQPAERATGCEPSLVPAHGNLDCGRRSRQTGGERAGLAVVPASSVGREPQRA